MSGAVRVKVPERQTMAVSAVRSVWMLLPSGFEAASTVLEPLQSASVAASAGVAAVAPMPTRSPLEATMAHPFERAPHQEV